MASDFEGGDLPGKGKRRIKLTWPTIWKSLAVIIGILIVGILVTLLTRSLQSSSPTPDGTAAAFAGTMTSIYDQQATFTAAAITPTLDPQVAALQTQNALLAQQVQNQQNAPTQIPQALIVPTSTPVVLIATAQPTATPVVITVSTQPVPTAQTQGNAGQGNGGGTTAVPNLGAGQLILAPGEGILVTKGVVGTVWYLPNSDRQSAENYANSIGNDRSKRYNGVFPSNSSWGAVVRLPDAVDNPPACRVAFSSVALPSQGAYAGDISCWLVVEWAYANS